MRVLYSLLIALSTPFVLLYFAIRGLRDHAYLGRWGERFGFIHPAGKRGGILLHAASVGEFNAASPLIMALLKTYPDLPLTVTTLTPTGSERVKQALGSSVFHSFIPLDLSCTVARFLNHLRPRLIIVMETEIWPNLYLQAQRRNIPLMVVNARLSERSASRYQYISRLMREVLQSVAWLGTQSDEDTERWINCGAVPEHTETTGNLKFDLQVPASLNEQGAVLRSRWNRMRPVLVAASTHEADENVVIPAFAQLLQSLPEALLILVPRHPERFSHAVQSARAAGLRVELRSQGEACSEQAQCFVIDVMGELMTYYACGDVAFVGGSLGAQGGHNALEPAALGKPVMVGPNTRNAKEIVGQLLHCGAALCINDQRDFYQTAVKLLGDGALRERMGQAARALIETNRGALELTLNAVRQQLSSKPGQP